MTTTITVPTLLLSALLLCAAAPSPQHDAHAHAAAPAAAAPLPGDGRSDALGELSDAPLDDDRHALLELAFEAASALPLDPHAKTRARLQHEVITAALSLDQPSRALRFAADVVDWRQGLAFADVAFALAGADERDRHPDTIDQLLARALQVADTAPGALAQEWRRDRVRSRVAQTMGRLGRVDEAAAIEEGLVASESGALGTVMAGVATPSQIDAQLDALADLVATGNFEVMQHALDTAVAIAGRFHDDLTRRERAEALVLGTGKTIPSAVRLDLLLRLAELSHDHGDDAHARELLAEARALVNGLAWMPEDRLRLLGQVATLSVRVGDESLGRALAGEALALYDSEQHRIVDIFRAEALAPVAGAWHALGDRDSALRTWREVVEAGARNPNARPRAEDLAQTCCAMATGGFTPDDALWTRLRALTAGLVAPW